MRPSSIKRSKGVGYQGIRFYNCCIMITTFVLSNQNVAVMFLMLLKHYLKWLKEEEADNGIVNVSKDHKQSKSFSRFSFCSLMGLTGYS